MTVNRSFVAAVALIAAIAMSAVGANTAPAARTASAFELTLEETLSPWTWTFEGTFAAGPPFCRSGTSVQLPSTWEESKHRLTCADGSGSLLVAASFGLSNDPYRLTPVVSNSWRILEGTGSYVGLRGKGSLRTEVLRESLDPDCVRSESVPDDLCPWIETWRSTLQGVVAEDAIAPKIGFSSVDVTKLPRPAGAYSLDVAIDLRDDVEGAPVSYLLRVTPTTSARWLASDVGTADAGTVSMTLPVHYYKPRVRAVVLRLTASDDVGNESSVSRVVKLPR